MAPLSPGEIYFVATAAFTTAADSFSDAVTSKFSPFPPTMNILLILVIVLLLGGGGYGFGSGNHYLGGGASLLVIILVVLLLTGRI